MTKNPLRSSAGFTYIAALVMVVIMGIMITRATQSWTMRAKRAREAELIYQGTQVRDALRRWYNVKYDTKGVVSVLDSKRPLKPGGPRELADLLKGSELQKVRYLRPSSMKDPMTGKDWTLVKDGAQSIIGVSSSSELAPLKQANFPSDLEPGDFEGKKKYSEWVFIYNRAPKPASSNAPTTPGANPPTGTNPSGFEHPVVPGGPTSGSGSSSP
jgi:type II secretory pathway pseudopilin PulG